MPDHLTVITRYLTEAWSIFCLFVYQQGNYNQYLWESITPTSINFNVIVSFPQIIIELILRYCFSLFIILVNS